MPKENIERAIKRGLASKATAPNSKRCATRATARTACDTYGSGHRQQEPHGERDPPRADPGQWRARRVRQRRLVVRAKGSDPDPHDQERSRTRSSSWRSMRARRTCSISRTRPRLRPLHPISRPSARRSRMPATRSSRRKSRWSQDDGFPQPRRHAPGDAPDREPRRAGRYHEGVLESRDHRRSARAGRVIVLGIDPGIGRTGYGLVTEPCR